MWNATRVSSTVTDRPSQVRQRYPGALFVQSSKRQGCEDAPLLPGKRAGEPAGPYRVATGCYPGTPEAAWGGVERRSVSPHSSASASVSGREVMDLLLDLLRVYFSARLELHGGYPEERTKGYIVFHFPLLCVCCLDVLPSAPCSLPSSSADDHRPPCRASTVHPHEQRCVRL